MPVNIQTIRTNSNLYTQIANKNSDMKPYMKRSSTSRFDNVDEKYLSNPSNGNKSIPIP